MRTNTIFWGAMLILVGILLVFSNLGWISVNVWGLILSIFLIFLGITILWGVIFTSDQSVEKVHLPLEDIQQARITLKHGAGRLEISAASSEEALLEGEFGGGVEVKTHQDGAIGDVSLQVSPKGIVPFAWWPGGRIDWSVFLTPQIPLDLRLELGANEANIDLGELLVSELTLKTGASSTEITLPARAGFTHAKISSGAAAVGVRIPSNVSARIQTTTGLSEVSIDRQRFPRTGKAYQSSDYDTAENKVHLEIDTGVGSVSVR